ncbi:hypothetical protein IQ260_18590 [Leptolyngbya cf. ectocarpi LEGE 11479]|uniref:Uncharacterized protein n=1 Tax=Leptolyngbya cf. ectocarpi LEGE 11479 TaxID=1828722 RepID=A0A928ZW93_LEPEC|nr:hypothetical protein [Leptolyngbya ectocarpi]MBE9068657.1 hypothetical protein [Leptolyngbya cf. ectocarpi LEGE 11479]
MATNVLDQLKEVDSQLASQVEALSNQLSAAAKQREGLQTVIDLFQSTGSTNGVAASVTEILTSAAASAGVTESEPEPAPAKKPGKKRGRKPSAKTAEKAKAAVSKTKTTKAKAAAEKVTTTRKPRGGKSPNWQRYVQDPFRKTPLPDVVANILKAQPDEAFKIAEVMEAIFKSDMPKATFLKARNRVSNILSAGARTSEWYRGRGGKYSMSKKALT